MNKIAVAGAAFVALVSSVSPVCGQSVQPIRPATSRAFTSDCFGGTDDPRTLAGKIFTLTPEPGEFIRTLDAALGFNTTFLALRPVIFVPTPEGMMVTVLWPYANYRLALLEAIRQREPVGAITMSPGVAIHVSPGRIDSLDIIKIIVERDDKEVAPILNTLAPTVLETRLGAKAVLHAGAVVFPCGAFSPGGRVRVILIPRVGANIEHVIAAEDLVGFSPARLD